MKYLLTEALQKFLYNNKEIIYIIIKIIYIIIVYIFFPIQCYSLLGLRHFYYGIVHLSVCNSLLDIVGDLIIIILNIKEELTEK